MKKRIQTPLLVLVVSIITALSIYGASAFQDSQSTNQDAVGSPEASPAASPAATPGS